MGLSALPSSLLFACNRNTVRSPMAEGLARHYLGSRVFVASCGVDPGDLDPFAVAVMAEFGIDISGHVPQSFEELDGGSFDLILTLAPEAHHRALDLTRTWSVEVEYWATMDPTVALETASGREAILDSYRAVRLSLERRILGRFLPDRPASL